MTTEPRPYETEDYKPGDNGKFPDGKFYPDVLSIGTQQSLVPTYDHKLLIIRLEQTYYDYGRLEDLVALGVEAKRKRADEIKAYYDAAKAGTVDPAPLRERDLWAAYMDAKAEVDQAQKDFDAMRRPRP